MSNSSNKKIAIVFALIFLFLTFYSLTLGHFLLHFIKKNELVSAGLFLRKKHKKENCLPALFN